MAKRKLAQKSTEIRRVRAKAKAKKSVELKSGWSKVGEKTRVWIGADLSLHSLALAGLAYDSVLKKWIGPNFILVSWNQDDHYFSRLAELAKCHTVVIDLLTEMKLLASSSQIFIAQEEPWPFGMASRGKGQSQTLKQQAEMSGAFLAGLLNHGYTNIYQIHNTWWRKIVADDLGITIHYSKWGKGIEGKMRPKQWCQTQWPLKYGKQFPNKMPVYADMVMSKGSRISQPKGSKAKPIQPDDRYQALPMALWMMREEQEQDS
jgi:hypothetical protein